MQIGNMRSLLVEINTHCQYEPALIKKRSIQRLKNLIILLLKRVGVSTTDLTKDPMQQYLNIYLRLQVIIYNNDIPVLFRKLCFKYYKVMLSELRQSSMTSTASLSHAAYGLFGDKNEYWNAKNLSCYINAEESRGELPVNQVGINDGCIYYVNADDPCQLLMKNIADEQVIKEIKTFSQPIHAIVVGEDYAYVIVGNNSYTVHCVTLANNDVSDNVLKTAKVVPPRIFSNRGNVFVIVMNNVFMIYNGKVRCKFGEDEYVFVNAMVRHVFVAPEGERILLQLAGNYLVGVTISNNEIIYNKNAFYQSGNFLSYDDLTAVGWGDEDLIILKYYGKSAKGSRRKLVLKTATFTKFVMQKAISIIGFKSGANIVDCYFPDHIVGDKQYVVLNLGSNGICFIPLTLKCGDEWSLKYTGSHFSIAKVGFTSSSYNPKRMKCEFSARGNYAAVQLSEKILGIRFDDAMPVVNVYDGKR